MSIICVLKGPFGFLTSFRLPVRRPLLFFGIGWPSHFASPFAMPSTTLYLVLVLAAGWRAMAANDWSVPCTQGKCSWDLPADSGASGTVHIVRLCSYQQQSPFRAVADCALCTHSGVLPPRFRTLPLPLAGELRVATRFPRRKTFSSFARITIPTVATSFKGVPWILSFVCQTAYVAFAAGRLIC